MLRRSQPHPCDLLRRRPPVQACWDGGSLRARHPDLEAALQQRGIAVTPVPLYRTEALAGVQLPAIEDAITVFTSPSGVRAYAALSPQPGPHIAIGPSTAAAMATAGVRCDATAAEPTATALIRSCLEIRNA